MLRLVEALARELAHDVVLVSDLLKVVLSCFVKRGCRVTGIM